MHSKLVLYLLALLTGLAVGPQASAGADKAQAVEQCAAASIDGGSANWFAVLADSESVQKPASTQNVVNLALPDNGKDDCAIDSPVARRDKQRE